MLNTATKLLLALAGGALVAQSAIAGSVTYNDGDLLLGFRASSGTGSSNDLVVDLGQASTLAAYTSAHVLSIGNIGADLYSNFGSGWASRSDLFWSVAGTAGQAAVGSDPAHTLYVTTQQAVPGVQSSARVRANYAAQSGPTNKITSLGGSYVATAGVANSSTANSTVAVLQPTSAANSYASLQSTASSYGYFTPVAEGTFGSGVSGSLLDLYQLQPSSSAVAGNYVGRFSIDGTGALTFTPASLVGANTVQLAASTYSLSEADASGHVTVTVQRSGDLLSATSVTVATADGTAIAGADYTSTTQTVNFGVGDTSKTVDIPVANRSGYQGDRNFTVNLSGVSGGTTLGSTASSTVTITENIVSSVIAFNSTSYSASSGDATVTLTFTRSGGGAPVTATIASTNGTAHAGTDFVAPTGSAATVSFPANVNTATATITLIAPSVTRPVVNFTVALTAAGTNASLTTDSSKRTATVTLPFLDKTKPTVRVVSPSSGQAVAGTVGGAVTVSGTAADNIAVTSVEVALNGGAWTAASVSHPLVGYAYSLSVTPRSGLNTLQVRATDSSGNVSIVAVSSFTYVVKVALTITASAGGSVTGALSITTANPYPYQVGNSYKVTAVPQAGYVFDGWSTGDNIGSPAKDLKALSFVVSEALAASPTITANFIPTPFTSDVVGAFNGLVTATTGVTPSNSTEGFITLTVTATGSFTGTLKIDGVTLALSGNVDNTGAAYFGANHDSYVLVPHTGKPSLVLSNVSLDLTPAGTNEITGALDVLTTIGSTDVTTATALSTFVADRSAYSTTAAAPTYVTTGKYDIVIPAQAQTNGLTSSQFPQGDGIGQISVSAAGVATLSGTLADGTALSATAPLSKNNTAPLFAQLYTTKGSFSAFVTFDTTSGAHSDSDLQAPVVRWFKPSGLIPAPAYYPDGWPTGVTTQLNGAKLDTTAGPIISGLGAVNAAHGNADLVFADGGLTSAQTKAVNISSANVVTKAPAAPATAVDNSFTLTLTAATGKFSGTYKVGSSTTASLFNAQVYQKGSGKGAYGYFLNAAAGLSGGVSLTHE